MARSISGLFGIALAAGLLPAIPASALTLPFGIPGIAADRPAEAQATDDAPVVLAQAGDASVRMSQMEEEMRRLNGKVEEMSFLVLQLQEQLRNTQADNELRFQDLEGGGEAGSTGGATPSASDQRTQATPGSAPSGGDSGDQDFALGLPPSPESTGTIAPPVANAASQSTDDEIAAILDQTSASTNAGAATAAPAGGGSQTVASIAANGPVELYSLAYNYLLAGDYHLAEQSFRQYSQAYPDSEDAPDANYWLGESLFAQSKFRDAAEVFLNAQKAHPDSGKAPEMMLKLGMSLARLENRDTACVTYAEVERRYPQMSANVKRKLDAEESAASCG